MWTWVAIYADTKLLRGCRGGDSRGATAIEFTDDVREWFANRVQLATDGHRADLGAVEAEFGGDIVGLGKTSEPKLAKRVPYKRRNRTEGESVS